MSPKFIRQDIIEAHYLYFLYSPSKGVDIIRKLTRIGIVPTHIKSPRELSKNGLLIFDKLMKRREK